MIRNLKALGLALIATFALSAVAASAASAQQGKLTAPEKVTLTGTEIAGQVNALTSPLGKITCPGSTYTGHAVLTHAQTTEGKKHEFITSGATEVTIVPKYVNCSATIPILGSRPATVLMTGCDYDIKAGVTTGEHTYGAKAKLTCPPGVEPHVEIFKAGAEHTEGNRICTITFAEQEVEGAHLTHTTAPEDDIDLQGTFTNVKEHHSGSLCGTGENTNASIDINVTITGHNELGEEIPVTITD